MVKYFRNIGQLLLSNGKTDKNLKYADGEFILIVIGILIACSPLHLKINEGFRFGIIVKLFPEPHKYL